MPRGGLELGAAALGGALLALGLPTPGLWAFAWFCLVPLVLLANESGSVRRAAALGFAAGLGDHLVILYWIYPTCRFAQVPVLASALAWFALAAVLAANWAAAAALARWTSPGVPRVLRPLVWALGWTALASFSSRWTARFGVDVLGYTQWNNLNLLQAGSWGGPHVLDFLIVLVNASLAEAWIDCREKKAGAAVASLSAALALAAGIWAHGACVLASRPETRGETAKVEILQPRIDQYHKFDDAWMAEVFATFEELLARPRAGAPALVVWPETSIPRWTRPSVAVPEAARWAVKLGAPQLVGIIASPEGGAGPGNAAQLIAPDGKVDGFYAKRQLVPFGEFVPLRRFVPRFVIDRWLMVLDQLGDMEPGAERQPLLLTKWGPAALTICYEDMFPRWDRLDASRGARLLINITNDAWYLDTWNPRQHYRVNRFRAVENRLTVIRSGNNGISAVIDPWGVTTAELALHERGRLDAEVPLDDPFPARSFYVRHGDWLGAACLWLIAALCVRRFFI
jgi:apolipoprotein N-acyltransferase